MLNWSKYKLKTGPGMLRNIIGPILTYKTVFFLVVLLAFEKSSSFCKENEIFQKTQKNKKWTSF